MAWLLALIILVVGCGIGYLGTLQPPRPVPLPPRDDPSLEPWRNHPRVGVVGLMPIELVLMLIPSWRLVSVERMEQERCTTLAASIAAEGIKEPLVVKVDQTGKTTLHNGTHRAIVSWRMGFTHLPVIVEPATHLKTFSQPASAVIDTLARALKTD